MSELYRAGGRLPTPHRPSASPAVVTRDDILISVCYTLPMSEREHSYKIRRSTSRGTPSYQLGHYEMVGNPGKRRSVFKVDLHLGEYASAEEALSAWPGEIRRLDEIGRENKSEKLQGKLDRLRELTKGDR